MKKIKLFLLASLILCNLNIFAQKKFSVSAELLNNTGISSFMLINVETKDTVLINDIIDDKFSFKAELDNYGLYIIYLNEKNMIFLVPEEKEKIKIIYDFKNPRKVKVTGSPETEYYYELTGKFEGKSDIKEFHSLFVEEIDKNPKHLIYAYYLAEIFDIQSDKDLVYINKVLDNTKKYANLKHIIRLESLKKIRPGFTAPEIAMESPDGKILKLSDNKGKYVLIDFWASWCSPCRAESPNLVKLYNKYKDKEFTIFSVSLDERKTNWKEAIIKDNLGEWQHVSDLKAWQCEAAKNYGVEGIPYTVLIDKKGVIIDIGLRGHKLEKKLAEIFDK